MRRHGALLFILLSLAFQLLSGVVGKYAALSQGPFTIAGILRNHLYMLSLACLGLQALCWPLALRHIPLFQAYLFMNGTYVALPFLGRYIFHETLTPCNIVGAILIGIGISFLLRGGEEVSSA